MIRYRGTTFREATEADLRGWYGKVPCAMKAQCAEKDGKIIGIWGVSLPRAGAIAFSSLTPEMKQDKRLVAFGLRMAKEMFAKHQGLIAIRSAEEPTSDGFLRHAGFRHAGDSGVYVYG